MARVAGVGVTVILAKVPAFTTTVAVLEMLPLVAVIVLVNVPGVVPAVNTPVVATIVPPPAATDHVGVIETVFPLPSLPSAVNV